MRTLACAELPAATLRSGFAGPSASQRCALLAGPAFAFANFGSGLGGVGWAGPIAGGRDV